MALRFLNSGYFAGKVGIGTASPTATLTISSDVGADGSWNKSGILIENTSTTTGEPTLAFRNAGTAGTGANYWHTGLNQSNIYKLAYGTSFTDGNTKFELATDGGLRLNSYTQGFLQTDANGNVSTSGGGTLPGGPYLPLSAGSGFPLTGELYVNSNTYSQTYRSSRTDGEIYIQATTANDFVSIGTQVANNLMRIQGNGNVGIGTTSPIGKLYVGPTWDTSAGGNVLYIKDTSVDNGSYDPQLTNTTNLGITMVTDSATTTGPDTVGLTLYNNDETAGGFSPMLLFSKLETTPSKFKATMAGIYARSPLGTGNSNSWIDGELIFATAGAASQGIKQRMVINKEGNVGIGTIDPHRTLHVYGQFALSNSNNSGSFLMIPSSGTNKIYSREADNVTSSNALSVVMGVNEVFHITTNGSVGIRNADPLEELDVRSTSFSTAAVSTDRNTATENIGSFAFYGRNDAATPERLIYTRIMSSMPSVTDGSEGGDIFFQQINNGTVNETIRVLANGNLGVGEFTPTYKIDVKDSVNNADVGIRINNSFDDNLATSNPNAVLFLNAASNNGYLRVHGAPANTAAKHQIDLGSSASTSFLTLSPGGSEKVRIYTGGNVGINTAGLTVDVPDLLTISGNAKYIAHYDGTNYAFKLGADSSGDGNFQMYSSDSTVRVKLYAELNSDNYINNNGNFGLGESSPLAKLHVKTGETNGIKTVYGDAIIESLDAQLDLLSTSAGTWGSAINFVESDGVDANTDVWSIARQTTGGAGNSGLTFNFGTNNQHQNPTQVQFSTGGQVTSNYTVLSSDANSTLATKKYVDDLITGATLYRGAWDPSGGGYGSPDLSGVTQTSGYYYICSAAGTAEPNGAGTEPDSWSTGDWVIWNDDIGTAGEWQKIDNSSVLSGVGTGTKIAKWAGASTVTDSDTLENSIISDLSTSIDVDGGVTADYFRTDETTTEYSLISRDSTGNASLYVQHSSDSLAQPLARFSYGATNAGGGTTVLQLSKDNSHFLNTAVGIGTASPGTINGVVFTGVGLHVASTGIGRTITSGATWAEYILNDEGASVDERAKFMESNQGVLSFGSYDDDGTQRTAVEIKNNGQLKTLYNLVVGDGTKTGGDNMYIQMGLGLDVYVNREFNFDPAGSNTSAILLLCAYAPYNNMNGSVQMDRTSGLRHSCRADIVISAGTGTNPIGVMKVMGLAGAGEPSYRLVKFNKVDDTTVYIGLEITNPDGYYENTGAYFNGRVTSTGDSLVSVLIGTATGQAENITIFEENGIHDFHGDVEIEGNLAVSGQVDGDLTIADDLTVVDQLTVGGVTTLNDPLTVNVDLATAYNTTGYNDLGIVLNNKNDDNVTGMYSTVVLAASGWESTSTGVVQLNAIQEGSNRSDGTFTIKVRDNGTHYEAFRIKYNGNVGIGITDPIAKLHVYQDDDADDTTAGMTIEQDGTGDAALSFLLSGGKRWKMGIDNSDADKFKISTSTNLATDNKVTIDVNGRVGIGDTGPSSILSISDSVSTAITMKSSYDYNQNRDWQIVQNNFGLGNWGGFSIKQSTAQQGIPSIQRFGIDKAGNVGIGIDASNTAVYSKLQVEGGIKMGDDTDAATVNKVGTMRYRTATDEAVPVTGIELITNGDFATDTDWTTGADWAIAGGTANAASPTSNAIFQTVSGFTAGNKYRVRFEVTAVTSGQIRVYCYVGAAGTFTNLFTSEALKTGFYEGVFEFGGTNKILRFYGGTGSNTFAGSIDNISVVEVTEEDASYADMCMQTGASTYEWVNIVRNTY